MSLVFIYRSDEFQIFLKDTKDYSKSEIIHESIIELSEKYQRYFSHVSLSEHNEEYIQDSLNYFKSTLIRLQSFQEICKQTVENYEIYARDLTGVLDRLNEVGRSLVGQENTVVIREECINPYGIVQDWLINEIYDIKCIIKAIETRTEIRKTVTKVQAAADQQQLVIEKVASGKKSLLRKGSKEDIKEVAQNTLIKIMHELDMAKITEKIISCRLAKIEIPYFRKTKVYHFGSILRAFINANTEEFTSLIDQSKHLLYTHNK